MEAIKLDAADGEDNAKYLLRQGHLHPLFVGDDNRKNTEKEWKKCITVLEKKLPPEAFYSKQLSIKPPELLDFKLRILQCQGVRIIAPYIAHGDFLKRDLEQPLS